MVHITPMKNSKPRIQVQFDPHMYKQISDYAKRIRSSMSYAIRRLTLVGLEAKRHGLGDLL